jgi:hypothetical protein
MPLDSGVPPGLGSPTFRARPTPTPAARPLVHSQYDERPDTRSGLVAEPDIFAHHPSSYSSAVNTSQKRAPMPDMASTSSTGSDNNDEVYNGYTTPLFNGSRRINPNIVSMT